MTKRGIELRITSYCFSKSSRYLAVSVPTFSLEESPTLETIRAFRIEGKKVFLSPSD